MGSSNNLIYKSFKNLNDLSSCIRFVFHIMLTLQVQEIANLFFRTDWVFDYYWRSID